MPTKIEWCDETWNFLGGCSPVSEGCLNCAAARQAAGRLKNHPLYKGLTKNGKWTGEIRTCLDIGRPDILEKPLHWKQPRIIFPCFMGDLFNAPFEFIDKIMAVIALCPQHIFLILTKRVAEALEYFTGSNLMVYPDSIFMDEKHIPVRARDIARRAYQIATDKFNNNWAYKQVTTRWPIPNLWPGVSVENQKRADERIPILLQIPAAKRLVSIEPCLSKINLTPWLNTDMLESKKEQTNERKRIDVSEPSSSGSFCCGQSGPDMEIQMVGRRKPDRNSCSAKTSPEGTKSGKVCFAETPKNPFHSQQEAIRNLRPQSSMDTSSPTANSRLSRNKSQRRHPNEQQNCEFRISDSKRKHKSRGQGAESFGQETTAGGTKCGGEINSSSSLRNKTAVQEQSHSTNQNRGIVQRESSDHICNPSTQKLVSHSNLDLVIIGGESGPKRRPCKLEDVRDVVRQCKAAGVSVFVKQLNINGKAIRDIKQFPEDLQIREMPE